MLTTPRSVVAGCYPCCDRSVTTAGDTVQVFCVNDKEAVAAMIEQLQASPEERITLPASWTSDPSVQARYSLLNDGESLPPSLSLQMVLRIASLHTVSRRCVEALLELSPSSQSLATVMERHLEGTLSLPELCQLVAFDCAAAHDANVLALRVGSGGVFANSGAQKLRQALGYHPGPAGSAAASRQPSPRKQGQGQPGGEARRDPAAGAQGRPSTGSTAGSVAALPTLSLVAALLRKSGVPETAVSPLFDGRLGQATDAGDEVVTREAFDEHVLPLVEEHGRHMHLMDVLTPLRPRHYSIANACAGPGSPGAGTLDLVVSPVAFSTSSPTAKVLTSVAEQNPAALAAKFFRIWTARVEGRRAARTGRGTRAPAKAGSTAAAAVLGARQAVSMMLYSGADAKRVEKRGLASHFMCAPAGPEVLFSLEPNAAFHPPRDVSRPLVMVASGSGVAPFRAFLQERLLAGSAAGHTTLLWGVPRCAACEPLREELCRIRAQMGSDRFCVRVAVSREDQVPVLDAAGAPGPTTRSMPRCRLDALLRRDTQLRLLLQRQLRPGRLGGGDGFVYFCGSSGFVSSTMERLGDILADPNLEAAAAAADGTPAASTSASPAASTSNTPATVAAQGSGEPLSERWLREAVQRRRPDWLMRELRASGHALMEVFTDRRSTDDDLPVIPLSELILHNDPSPGQRLWLMISDNIYDVASFVHPGGNTILEAYAGMDCTPAWRSVRHDRSQSLNAQLSTLLIGRRAQPSLPATPTYPLYQLAGDGAASAGDTTSVELVGTVSIRSVYERVQEFVWGVVEVQNSVRIEYRLLRK